MHVVWKRPDGYHGALPSDYRVVDLANQARIWLHKEDLLWFPFRVSGGWQDEDATKKLNSFINVLGSDSNTWLAHFRASFGHSQAKDAATYYKETITWLAELKNNLKGDTWEVEIMDIAITEVEKQIKAHESELLKSQ